MTKKRTFELGSNPEPLATHWPTVATDHSLPWRLALTETSIGTLLGLAIIVGGLIVADVRELATWGFALFLTLIGALFMLLKRYEDHISYVRSDRHAETAEPDLDADGKPDRMKGVWYGAGAPPAAPGSLDAVYRVKFAEFCAACRAGDTSVRYLRSSGFDDNLQILFRNWLMDARHPAAQWVSRSGHTPGWELLDEDALRKVLRCTGWEPETVST